MRLMSPRSSGFIEGERQMKDFYEREEDVPIESLPRCFGTVATDLLNGQEIWFQEGPLGKAVRASIALPGLFSPIHQDGRWLVDGGLVNPVPVSLCRALGADRVIAVNLNAGIHNRQFLRRGLRARTGDFLEQLGSRFQAVLGGGDAALPAQDQDQEDAGVLTLFDVMTGALNIMQDRITRSRLAGDPPDVVLAPRLNHLALMDFDRAEQAIAEGMACVKRYQPVLKDALD
jgi:NTE family protein